MSNKNGMNWITKQKRLAIYLRDGMCCAYCGDSLEDNITLTLDHLTPRNHGGDNHETNLITACHKCNSSRGDRDLSEFVQSVAGYINHGVTGDMIMNHIVTRSSTELKPFIKLSKEIINLRPSWNDALKTADNI